MLSRVFFNTMYFTNENENTMVIFLYSGIELTQDGKMTTYMCVCECLWVSKCVCVCDVLILRKKNNK